MSDELLREHMLQDRESFGKLEAKLDALSVDLHALREELVRYKGFVGGIVFLVTALVSVFELLSHWK